MKTIAIQCTAAVNLNLADLTPLQGGLKELSDASFEKLKQSILKHGITFPFFVWQSEGENYILDGTQRDRVLTRLADEDYDIPPLPCALIQAEDRREAAEKILLISSNYGKMSDESLYEFLNENDLEFCDMEDLLELPDLDLDEFKKGYIGDPDFKAASEDDQGRLDQKSPVTCPECGNQFVPR
jgi:ParB-like nuclease domain